MTKLSYNQLRNRCNAHSENIRQRMRKLSLEAGLDPNLLGIHPHNAMVSFEAGKPWDGVDYRKVRQILWLERTKLFAARRILDTLYTRKGYEAFEWA